jgi:hypothetical protein
MIVGQAFLPLVSYASVSNQKQKQIFHISFQIFHLPSEATIHRLESGVVRLARWGTSAPSKQRNEKRSVLLTFEYWLTFFEKRARAFTNVFSSKETGK